VVNLDATVICERPKIGPHRDAIRANLARLIGVDADRVNVKGKTHERVDAVGEERAIEAHCVVLLSR
jgi:2-C-methyl-D-erythritol 2,4-cyclodiphosphate synthase